MAPNEEWSSWEGVSDEARRESGYYSYTVEWSAEDDTYIGRVAEWALLAAHGESPEEALHEIRFVVAAAIDDCQEQQDEYPEPLSRRSFSGKFSLRIPPELHRRLVAEAARQGVSLNQYVTTKLAGSI